ncbi:MAG: phytanoyl-CoA dioxygenase family protein [Caldilineaceae bacterium]|nr:phytanoyl-CoA dioxygenase family protein [Caldilineaceae bacterium]
MRLTNEQLAQYNEEGYVIVRGVFDPEKDIDPVIEEYKSVLDSLAHDLLDAGEITSLYEDLPFAERLIAIYQESGKVHAQYFDFSLPQGSVKPDTPFWAGPAVFRMLTNKSLLDAAESILGGEIYSNPVQHVRLKPPEHLTPVNEETGRVQLGKTPVHQDQGVVRAEADETQMLTVWFPLMDVDVENGCLCVWPRSHKRGLIDHCPTDLGLLVPGKLLEGKAVPMKMDKGDVLLMHKQTMHASYSNTSDTIRWSFDLRYNPTGQATGRPAFPGFVARSHKYPETVLREPSAWEDLWRETRDHMAKVEDNRNFNRWTKENPVCA